MSLTDFLPPIGTGCITTAHSQPDAVPEPLSPDQARALVSTLDEMQLQTLVLALARVKPTVMISSHVTDHVERWVDDAMTSLLAASMEGRVSPQDIGLVGGFPRVPEGYTMTGERAFDDVLRECIEVMRTKGADYAGGSQDRLSNFREAGRELDLPMRQILYVYLWKHLAAVRRYCVDGELASEALRGRVVDAINYLLILALIDQDEKREQP